MIDWRLVWVMVDCKAPGTSGTPAVATIGGTGVASAVSVGKSKIIATENELKRSA